MKTIHPVYENGVFHPMEPVELPDHTEVEFEPKVVRAPASDGMDGIYAVLAERYASGEHDVAARHNDHQP